MSNPNTRPRLEELVTKSDNPSPEYQRLISAYAKDPLYDMTVREDEGPKETEEKPDQPE